MLSDGGEDGSPVPKVDVVIPAYNDARYLPAAIGSVEAQTFTDWRILLVDDGSTDGTAEVVAPFAERLGPKLKYIRQENGGMSAARNTALRNSSAEFLAMLDADDMWLPERLAESLASFERRPQAILSYGLISWIDAEGKLLDTFAGNDEHIEGRIASHIYTRKVQLPCATIMFRREAIDTAGVFDETMRGTEDREYWLRMALQADVVFVPKVIALYRLSAGTVSTDQPRMLGAQLQFVRKHYGAEGCGFVSRQIALGRIYQQNAEVLAKRGQRGAAAVSTLRALMYAPFDTDNVRTTARLALRGLWSK